MSYVSIGPVRFDPDNQFSIAIVGQQSDARTSVMKVILAELRLHAKSRPIELTIIDEAHHKLSSYKNDPWVDAYYDELAAIKLVFDAYEKKLIARRDKLQVQGLSIWNKEPYLVLIVNSADCLATVSGDNNTLERYKHIAQSYSNLHCLIVFSVPDVPVPFVGAPFLRVLKSEVRGFVLTQNIAEEKFYDVSPMALRANRMPLERGQAFLFRGNDVEKIRMASG